MECRHPMNTDLLIRYRHNTFTNKHVHRVDEGVLF